MTTTNTFLFRNANLLDPLKKDLLEGHDILVEGGVVREVSDKPLQSKTARVIDVKGKTVMPGLIDLHVHVIAVELNLSRQVHMPNVLITLRSVPMLRGMLRRGFTTVRDAGGAGFAFKQAVESGLAQGPRLFVSGPRVEPDGRAWRHARPLRLPRPSRDLLDLRARGCAGARGRRRRRGAPGRARRAADGRRPDQDHGLRRRGLAHRPGGRLRLQRGRDPRHRRRSRGARHLCDGARLHRRGHRARRALRRAHHRARQPRGRAHGRADGRAGRLRGADAGHLRRARQARASASACPRTASPRWPTCAKRACARWRST
jgi:hypothetical protein